MTAITETAVRQYINRNMTLEERVRIEQGAEQYASEIVADTIHERARKHG